MSILVRFSDYCDVTQFLKVESKIWSYLTMSCSLSLSFYCIAPKLCSCVPTSCELSQTVHCSNWNVQCCYWLCANGLVWILIKLALFFIGYCFLAISIVMSVIVLCWLACYVSLTKSYLEILAVYGWWLASSVLYQAGYLYLLETGYIFPDLPVICIDWIIVMFNIGRFGGLGWLNVCVNCLDRYYDLFFTAMLAGLGWFCVVVLVILSNEIYCLVVYHFLLVLNDMIATLVSSNNI